MARSLSSSSTLSGFQNWVARLRGRCSATRTLSSTERCPNTAEIWNERTSPSRATSAGASLVMSCPRKVIWPRVGVRNLVSRLKTVVLPAPFGPMRAWIEPSRTARFTSFTATKPLNSLVSPVADRIGAAGAAAAAASCGTAGAMDALTGCPFLLRHLAAAFLQRREGLVTLDGREVLVIVPRRLALLRRLDLEQVHVVDHAPVRQDLAVAGEEVVDGHLVQLLGDRLGGVRAGRLDGLEVLGDGRVGARVDHVGHAAGVLDEALGEAAALVVEVPVVAFREQEALSRLEAHAVHLGEGEEQRREPLAALHEAELGRALDGVGGVEARIGKADDLRPRGLRLQDERGVVGGGERMAHGAEDLAALGGHVPGGLRLERVAEGIVGGDEEPGAAALLDEGAAGADRERARVVGPVEAVGRALLAGEVGRRRAGDDVDLLLVLRDALDGERHRRG